MKVNYLGGGFNPGEFTENSLPEVAFMGRSNVGKSSLINGLCKQRQLARVSSTPGRTQAIHFFSVADKFCLVDLPGFGFAKAPGNVRKKWKPLVNSYLNHRPQLKLALLLVDIRREPRDQEFSLKASLEANNVTVLMIVTKTDKVPKTKRAGRIQQLAKAMGVPQSNALGYSALKKEGRTKILDRIYKELNV